MAGLDSTALVGAVGGGAMGAGIAQVAAAAGHPVVVLEVDDARAARAVEAVEDGLQRWVEKGRLAGGAAGEVRASTDDAALADAALLVEAVAENLAVKRDAELRGLLPGVAVTELPDTPGLLLARTLALLVDEAAALAARGTPAEQVDTAVRLGVGYPLGPLAWGDRVGASYLVALLDRLEALMPGGRFRVSTALRRAALTGTPLCA